MKFLVPNYSCLQNPLLEGYRPQIPALSVLCPQLNLLNPPSPRKKFLGTSLVRKMFFMTLYVFFMYFSAGLFLALFNDTSLTVNYVRTVCEGDKEIPKGRSRIMF